MDRPTTWLPSAFGLLVLGAAPVAAATIPTATDPASITPFQWGTLAIALIGAGLGLWNTVMAYRRDRVRLRVIPRRVIGSGLVSDCALPAGETDAFLLKIEVANLSAFAVTVDQVGFMLRGSEHRAVIANPILPDGGEWARRLEPHSSATARCNLAESSTPAEIWCAYAETASGAVAKGTSEALTDMSRRLSVLAPIELKEARTAAWRREERVRRGLRS